MGRTHTKKLQVREQKWKALPQSQRLLKSALVKKKEGRVLDASEKHALKMTSDHGEILRLWEKLRTLEDGKDDDEEEQSTATEKKSAYEHKYPVVEKLMHIIQPKFDSLIKTPVVSRVVQSMIKYGSNAHVEKVMKMLSKNFVEHATDAYGHFVVCALIRHVPHETFKKLLAYLVPAVPKLVSHRFGIEVIHAAYSSRWCSSLDRNILLLAIFKDNVAVMKRWKGYPVIEDVICQNPELQKSLLKRLFDLDDKLVSQKNAVGYPFVQRLVYAFLRHGTRDEVSELCDTLHPHIASIAQSREGAPLSSLAFSLLEPKKRKEVLRSFTDKLGELTTSKYAAPVIARLFDLLYDPQLMKKYIANDLCAHIGQVVNNPYGYQIVLHLLTPHDERKRKFLLPNWFEHNLYSVENKEWNHHAWLTSEYANEVVEICSKPAMMSHLAALPGIVEAFVTYVQEEKNAGKFNRHHVSLIAREILHIISTEPLYRDALRLCDETKRLLERLAPADGRRPQKEEAPAVPASKKVRTQKVLRTKVTAKKSGSLIKATSKKKKTA